MIDAKEFPFVDSEIQKRYEMFIKENQPIEKVER